MSEQVSNDDLKAHTDVMHSHVHKGIAGLLSLRKEWEGLHMYCDLWSRYEWYFAYISHLAVDSECIYFIQIIEHGKTIAIIPAELSRQKIDFYGSCQALCLAFHSHLSYTDFPLNPHVDPAKVAVFMLKGFKELPEKWDVIRWPRIMNSSNAIRVARLIRGYSVYIRYVSKCNSVCTNRTIEALVNSFSKNLRTHLRKTRKRLGEISSWYVDSSSNADNYTTSYEDFLRLESSGWKGKFGTNSAICLDKSTQAFYTTLLELKNTNFIPEITLLICDSHAIAGQFTIWTKGWKHILKIGYDEKYSKLAPGYILLDEVLKSSCTSTSVERVSFVSNKLWHLQWDPKQENSFDVMVFRYRLLGVVMGWYFSARLLAKSFILKIKESYASKIS